MKNFSALVALLFIAVLPALNVRAADHLMHMTSGWTFSPTPLTVIAGDTVTWMNADTAK